MRVRLWGSVGWVTVLLVAAWCLVALGGGSAVALGVATAVFASATVVAIALTATAVILMIAVRRERRPTPPASRRPVGQERSVALAPR